MDVEVFDKQPEGFTAQVEVSACYVEVAGKVLLLQNSSEKDEPGKWGLPAGKREGSECAKSCALRELFEETGIQIDSISKLQPLVALYYRKPAIDYVFHIFKLELNAVPNLFLSYEHQGFVWAGDKEIETLSLMSGAKEALFHCQDHLSKGL